MNKFRRFLQWVIFGDRNYMQKITNWISSYFRNNNIYTDIQDDEIKKLNERVNELEVFRDKIKEKLYIYDDLK